MKQLLHKDLQHNVYVLYDKPVHGKYYNQNSKTEFAINLLKELPIIGKPFKLLKSFMDNYLNNSFNINDNL